MRGPIQSARTFPPSADALTRKVGGTFFYVIKVLVFDRQIGVCNVLIFKGNFWWIWEAFFDKGGEASCTYHHKWPKMPDELEQL